MNLTYLSIAGFIFILLVFLLYYLKKKASANLGQYGKNICQTDKDCKAGQRCFVDPQYPAQSICAESNMKRCEFMDFTKLSVCDPNDPNSCNDCLNQPPFACVRVSFGKPVIVNAGRNYTSGIVRAALIDPRTNVYNIDRYMEVVLNVADSTTGIITSILILNPKEKFNKEDSFKILGGNNEALIRLTEQPKPYFWQKDGKRVVIPESPPEKGWCLPPVDESIKCNPNTADSVLVQKIDAQGKVSYAWGCYCKLPSFMQHDDTAISNCSTLVGCGGFDLYIPPKDSITAISCTSNNNCTLPNTKCCNDQKCLKAGETFSTASPGQCYSKWITGETERSPRYGTCDCPSNTYYYNSTLEDYVVKSCNVDACEPTGTKGSGNTCTCKPGNVSCGLYPGPGIVVTNERCASTTTSNRCVPDPCKPGGTIRSGGGCDCDLAQGFVEVVDVNAVGGKTCRKLCVDNGPCGNRGKCRIEGNREVCDCLCPFAPTDINDKFCSLYLDKFTAGQRCKEDMRVEKTSVWDNTFTTIYTPVTNSCCAPYKCQYAPGTNRYPVCTL